MPQIPMSQRAGLIGHVRSSSPLNAHGIRPAAPSNNGEALLRMQQNLNAGVASLADYFERAQAVDDKLAAAEDRALLRENAAMLEQQLAENPGASEEEKTEWIRSFQGRFAEQRKELLARMSPDFRKLHDVEITAMEREIADRQILILTQTGAQRRYDEAMNQYKRFTEQGNWAEAERLVGEMEGDVWTAEQAARLRDVDLPMRKDHFTAKAMADDVPQLALDELNAKDKDGNFVNFKNLTPDDRRALIKYAQSVAYKKEEEEDLAMAAAYEAGEKRYSDAELLKRYKDGEFTDRQYVKYLNWNKAAAREETAQIKRQETLRRQERNNALEIFEATQMYNSDGSPKALTPADAARICTEASEKFFKNDPHGLTDFYKLVNGQVEKIVRKNSFAQTDEGKALLKYINSKNLSEFAYRPWFGINKDDTGFLLVQKLQMLASAENIYNANNKNIAKATNEVDTLLSSLQDAKITSILAGLKADTRYVKTGTKNGRNVFTVDGGKNWYYEK